MANFEDQLTALESVVERLERGELSLEDSVRLFEEVMALLRGKDIGVELQFTNFRSN